MAYIVILALVVVIVFLLVRILNLTDSSHSPKIYSSSSHFTNTVLQSCPILFERYVQFEGFCKCVFVLRYQNNIRIYVN